jgi:hypothetical protein
LFVCFKCFHSSRADRQEHVIISSIFLLLCCLTKFSFLFSPGWPGTMILQISGSQVAKITGLIQARWKIHFLICFSEPWRFVYSCDFHHSNLVEQICT